MKRLILVAALIGLVSACGTTTPVAVVSPSPSSGSSPSASASPSALPSPSPSAVASPTVPAGFVLANVSGGSVAISGVSAVRIGQHNGYDRFVIEFSGGVPQYSVTRQSSATFIRSPKGDTVKLEGSAGVLITIHSVSNW